MQASTHETSNPAPRARRVLVVVRSALGWILLAAGLWFVWPSSLGGCTTLTVVSGHSMEPTYHTGDLVVARCGTPSVGDVAVYRPSSVSGSARIIHRVVGGDGATGYRLQGDNNTFEDPFTPTQADVIGVAVLHVPQVGRVSTVVFNPWVWLAVILAAAVLLIWPSDDGDDEDAATDAGSTGAASDDDPQADAEPSHVDTAAGDTSEARPAELLLDAGSTR